MAERFSGELQLGLMGATVSLHLFWALETFVFKCFVEEVSNVDIFTDTIKQLLLRSHGCNMRVRCPIYPQENQHQDTFNYNLTSLTLQNKTRITNIPYNISPTRERKQT